MRFSTAAFLTLLTAVSATPLSLSKLLGRQTDLQAITDKLLFSETMDQFQTARNSQNPPQLDWSSDGCSYSPDDPLGFDFLESCERHDFGYRNYKAQSRFTDANKAKLDLNLKSDLYKKCSEEKNPESEDICKGVANIYYDAVRDFGSKRAIEAGLEQFDAAPDG